MKLFKRLTAAGLAGCMLLMGTVPEAVLAAQDLPWAPVSTATAEDEEAFTVRIPVSTYAEPGQLISLPFRIVNNKSKKKIKEVKYETSWTSELSLVDKSFLPEVEHLDYTCQLNFWVKVDKKAPIIEPNEEFHLKITGIVLEDGEEVPAEDLPDTTEVVCFRLQEPSDPLEPVTRIKLSPGEAKNVWFDITADESQLISTIGAGGWAVDMSDPLAGIDWDAWDGKSTVIDGKQHLRLRVELRAKENLTPGIVYEKELNLRSHAKDENGKSGKDLGRDIVSNPKFELIIGDPLPPTEPPTSAPTQKPTQPATDPTEATTEPMDVEAAFKPLLDFFRKNVANGWKTYSGKTAEGILNSEDLDVISSKWLDECKDKGLDQVGYDYYDGVLSLTAEGIYRALDAYSISGDKIIHLCSAGDNTTYYFSGDLLEEVDLGDGASRQTMFEVNENGIFVPERSIMKDKDGKHYVSETVTVLEDGSYEYNWEEKSGAMPQRTFKMTPLSENVEPTEVFGTDPTEPVTDPTEANQSPTLEKPTTTHFTASVPEINLAPNEEKTIMVNVFSKDNTPIDHTGSGAGSISNCHFEFNNVTAGGKTDCAVPVTVYAGKKAGTFTTTINILVVGTNGVSENVIVPFTMTVADDAEPVTDPTEATEATEATTSAAPECNVAMPANIKVDLNKTKTVNLEVVSSSGKTIKQIGSGAAGSPQFSLKWDVVKADNVTKCTVPVSIMAKGTAGSYTPELMLIVTFTDGSTTTIPVKMNFTIGEIATEPTELVTEATEGTEPTAYETIDLKFGTPTPFTKEIGGAEAAIRVNGLYNVTGPKVLDGSGTDDAAVIAELKGYVLEAVQHAVMNTDFTADDYVAHLIEIQRSAADYFAEKGYNEKTGYTLKSIAIASMVVTPVETATEATTQATEATEQLYCIEKYGSWSKPVEYTGEPLTFDLALAESKTPVKEAVFELQNADALPFKVEIGTTITNKEYKDADAALDPDFKGEYPSYYDVILPVKVTMDESAPSGDYTMNFLCKKLVDENGNDLLKHFSPTDLKSTELVSVYKMTLDNQTATNPVDDHLYNISAPEIRSLSVGEEYTFDVEVSRKDGKPIGTINGFRKMAEEYLATWETVTSDETSCKVPVTIKAYAPFSDNITLGMALQIVDADGNAVKPEDVNEEPFMLGITDAVSTALYEISVPEIPDLNEGQEYTFDVTVTRTDGKPIGTIDGFRKQSEEYYASWTTVTSEESTCKITVTLQARAAFHDEVTLGLASYISDADGKYVDPKDVHEDSFTLGIIGAPDDQLYNIAVPEIPNLTVGEEYTFDVEVTRKDGKAIGTINGFRKEGQDDYYASWSTVTSDTPSAKVTVTLVARGEFSGEVTLGIAYEIDGVKPEDVNEEALMLNIFEEFDPAKVEGLGNINTDEAINASDAALVLIAAASIGAGKESGLTEAQTKRADLNGDRIVNASDAAIILQYAALVGSGVEKTLPEYLAEKKAEKK
ncbi:MAG: dockerin type I repeat-containing protein [Oscillospiraceae bacterium]|nr:dockerin type I repeat-containing protein [Oscillospiraceae bacterium]